MSCFVVSPRSIIDLAAFINQICRSECYFVNPNGVRSVFANKYGYDEPKEIAKKLYDLNINAMYECYKKPCVVDFETFINGFESEIPCLSAFKLKDWCYILKKMQCYIYQCSEGDYDKSHVYLALSDMARNLETFIVGKLPEYQEAEWN